MNTIELLFFQLLVLTVGNTTYGQINKVCIGVGGGSGLTFLHGNKFYESGQPAVCFTGRMFFRYNINKNCFALDELSATVRTILAEGDPFAWCSNGREILTLYDEPELKFHNPEGFYFVSFSVVEWIDVLTRNEYKNILLESLAFCQKDKSMEIFARCIMTNHMHFVFRSA